MSDHFDLFKKKLSEYKERLMSEQDKYDFDTLCDIIIQQFKSGDLFYLTTQDTKVMNKVTYMPYKERSRLERIISELKAENEELRQHLINIAMPYTQQAYTKRETGRYRASIDYAIELKDKEKAR